MSCITEFSISFLEIVGTKDYRQPEWVTQMEEMREALRGIILKLNVFFYA